MLWRDQLKLISISNNTNAIGDLIETETKKDVFCNKKSIRQSEFYQAQAEGLRPELMFEVRLADYSDEKRLEYNSVAYNILRTYTKNFEIIELICNKLVN